MPCTSNRCWRHGLLLLLTVLCVVTGAPAQTSEFTDREIVEIEVVGAMTVNPRQVTAWAGLETGKTVNRNLIATAVRRLFATRKFSEIFIYGQEVPGGVKLIVNLREFPRIRSVTFTGNRKLKEKDLATYGFLGYPLLQSADILIYKAGLVPGPAF